MNKSTRIFSAGFALSILLAGSAFAQTSPDQPTSGSGVAQQFKTGANRVGDGAAQIGEGIKQGAILTWQSVQAGAESFAAKFSGNGAPQNK